MVIRETLLKATDRIPEHCGSIWGGEGQLGIFKVIFHPDVNTVDLYAIRWQ